MGPFFACRRVAATALFAALLPGTAAAYSIETAATAPCHEDITIAAWRQVNEALPEQTRPLRPLGDDRALIDDVPFTVPNSLQSIGPVTLLLGVRDNDLKHFGPMDLSELTPTASDPGDQAEHCLRGLDDDEPDGSRNAVEACRRFVRSALVRALDGLDEEGMPDTRKRETLSVSLAIRGRIDVEVPTTFLNVGRAMHAIQDSFTHSFRNPDDPGKIRVVLNFVDYTQDTLEEHVDGPPHASELDQCDDADELRTERRLLANEASAMALMTVLDPTLTPQQKEDGIEDVLDRYIAFDEGSECTADNQWCDAPERAYGSPTWRCGFAAPRVGSAAWITLAALGAFALVRRRRPFAALLVVIGSCALPSPVSAAEQVSFDSPGTTSTSESGPVPGKIDRGGAFFGRIAAGASYDNAAFSGGAGMRYQLSTAWMLGLDGEWNPYFATTPGELRSGSVNGYLSLIRRFQLRYEAVNIRSTISAGASMLMFDLVGADKYNVGPFFGISLLGVEWKLARGLYLTVDPTYIAIPVPSLPGVPFMYEQYRFLVGLEFGG